MNDQTETLFLQGFWYYFKCHKIGSFWEKIRIAWLCQTFNHLFNNDNFDAEDPRLWLAMNKVLTMWLVLLYQLVTGAVEAATSVCKSGKAS